MRVALRRAAREDARFVWEVNNHPSVRVQSVSTTSIPWDAHERWFASKLADPASLILVGSCEGVDAAVVRFDVCDGEATIGVAVSPPFQGRGFGSRVIAAATAELAAAFPGVRAVAWIRPENAVSQRAFARAGYVHTGAGMQSGVAVERFDHAT